MVSYAMEIQAPRTRKEGLMNFVQMIINAAERGDTREAILLAVDLKDTISGKANPYADITDGLTKEAAAKEVAAARKAWELEKAAALTEAFERGAATTRADMLQKLQAA